MFPGRSPSLTLLTSPYFTPFNFFRPSLPSASTYIPYCSCFAVLLFTWPPHMAFSHHFLQQSARAFEHPPFFLFRPWTLNSLFISCANIPNHGVYVPGLFVLASLSERFLHATTASLLLHFHFLNILFSLLPGRCSFSPSSSQTRHHSRVVIDLSLI